MNTNINISTEYGFSNIYIVPVKHSPVVSRRACDTSVKFDSRLKGEILFDMPLMLSPMSFFGENAIRQVQNKFLTFIPRIQAFQFDENEKPHEDWSNIKVRINHAETLFKEGYNFGVSISPKDDFNDVMALTHYTDFLLVDTANGYSNTLYDYTKQLRECLKIYLGIENGSRVKIITGNVISKKGHRNLLKAGSDMMRLGIGSGSNCTTTDTTAIGRPPLSMLMDIAEDTCQGTMIADGGIKSSGDLSLALLFSDYAMLSGVFKHSQLNLHYEKFIHTTLHTIPAYGMASKYAKPNNPAYVEGKLTWGEPTDFSLVYNQLKEGLQSTMSYLGVTSLLDYRNADFELKYSENY